MAEYVVVNIIKQTWWFVIPCILIIIFAVRSLIKKSKEKQETQRAELEEERRKNDPEREKRVEAMAQEILEEMKKPSQTVPEEMGGYGITYSYDNVKIAGTKYYTFQTPDFGEEVELRPEPENEYDNKAIAVYNGNGEKMGHLPRGKIKDAVFDYLDKKSYPVYSIFQSIQEDDNGKVTNWYIWIGLYSKDIEDDYDDIEDEEY